MIFNDKKIDGLIERYKVIQFSFITQSSADHYKQKLIENEYVDITQYFMDNEANQIDIDYLKGVINANNTVFDITTFYNHWSLLCGKPYNIITWSYYGIIKNLTELIPNNLIAISSKRTIQTAMEKKIELTDNILFCDFADLYIYPVYHEYKLYTQDMVTFNNFTNKVALTGEVPDKYNICMIQYMKISGNATERIYY